MGVVIRYKGVVDSWLLFYIFSYSLRSRGVGGGVGEMVLFFFVGILEGFEFCRLVGVVKELWGVWV